MNLLGFPLPFRHRRAAPAPTADPSPGPVYRAAAWRSAAPLQRTLAAPELVTAPARFRAELASWADPSLRGEPAHVVSPDAPSGLGHGLATPVAPVPGPEPAPVQRQAAEQGSWSRLWTRDAPVSVQRADAPELDALTHTAFDPAFDTAAAHDGAAVELPRPVLPVVAAPPASAGLVHAEHAPLPPPVARPSVPLQRAVAEPVGDALPETGLTGGGTDLGGPEIGLSGGGAPEAGVSGSGVAGGEGPGAGVPEIDVAGMNVAGSGEPGLAGGDAAVRPAGTPDRPLVQRTPAPVDGAADRPRPVPDTVPINAALQRSTSAASSAGTAGGGESTASAGTSGAAESARPAETAVHRARPAPAAAGPDRAWPSAPQLQRAAVESARAQTAQRAAPQLQRAAVDTAQGQTAQRAAAQVQRAGLDSAQGQTNQGQTAQGQTAQGDTVQRWADAGGTASTGEDVPVAAGPGDPPDPLDGGHPAAGPEATGPEMAPRETTAPVTTPTLGDGAAGVGSAGSGDGVLVQRSADAAGGAPTGGVAAASGAGGASRTAGGAFAEPRSASAAAPPELAAGVVQRTVGGAASLFTDRAIGPAVGGGGAAAPIGGVVQRAEAPVDAAPGRGPAPSAGGVVQRFPSGVTAPVTTGRRRFGLGAPVQRAVEGGPTPATSHVADPAAGAVPPAEPVAPLVGAGETVLGAAAFGAAAEQPASGGPGDAGSDPGPHTDHDEPTVQRAMAVGPLAGGAQGSHGAGDDVAPDAVSFGPLLGDVPLTSIQHAPPSSAATPSLPGTGTPAVLQRTTAPGSSSGGLPGGAAPLQRAGVSGSWTPREPAEPDTAPVFTGLVGATALVPDASAPATESAPTQGPPSGSTGTPLQRTPVPGSGTAVRTTFAAPGAGVGPSTRPPSVPASVQRLLAAQAAQAAEESVSRPEVQRAAEDMPETTPAPTASPPEPVAVQTATAVTAAPAPAASAQGSGGLTDVDALVGKLYDPLVRRLKAELRLDRERAGHVLDLRR